MATTGSSTIMMNKFLILFFAGLGCAAATCPFVGTSAVNWIETENSCYYIVITPSNWFEADMYCSFLIPGTLDTHLVSVDSGDEQMFLQNYLSSRSEFRFRNYWTSGNSIDKRRGFVWAATGEQISYTNWAPSEPNQSGNCAQIWGEFNYQWDDADCWGDINFICEYMKPVASTTTAPGSTARN